MTDALKRMVEAMHAEFTRQNGGAGATENGFVERVIRPEADGGTTLDGSFDLEKVARAGLEAVKAPDEDVSAAGRAWIRSGFSAEDVFGLMIAEILKGPAP
jgi:hypothetical protein